MIVTFCGHARFHGTEEYEQKILAFLRDNVGDIPADMYLGGYGDFDGFAYDCCKKYKKAHPNVSLVFVTPYLTVEYQKNHLEYQTTRYDSIVYPEIEDKPPRFAISYRNKWMVEKADYVVCCIEHDWGGAYKTYLHAKRQKKPIININGNCSIDFYNKMQ
jgi:uncharacterized phage-like protein YoqJ